MTLQRLRRYGRWIIPLILVGVLAIVLSNREILTGRWFGEPPLEQLDTHQLLEEEELPWYDAGLASFVVRVRDVPVPYEVMIISALPGEEVPLEVEAPDAPVITPPVFRAEAEGGTIAAGASGRWTWTAPDKPGLYPITIESGADAISLQAFVKRPFEPGQSVIDGYRIGTYAPVPLNNNPVYTYPDGFIEVTPDLLDTPVSPHFRLEQFLAKQASGYPKYLLLDERLVINLELLLEEVNADSIQADQLHVMSAFRTPFYNRAIGNTTTYSAHLYGIAADVFVDEVGDNYMDDLNEDGRVDLEDARLLYEKAEAVQHEYAYQGLEGGLGIYDVAPSRGPFIHVDVRGDPVRWGP